MILVNVFRIWDGRTIEVAIPWESYPVLETEFFRRWTGLVHPCYDINNNYMGYMDNGLFYDMRKNWYCAVCNYETDSFWMAVLHDIKHFLCMRKRHKVENN